VRAPGAAATHGASGDLAVVVVDVSVVWEQAIVALSRGGEYERDEDGTWRERSHVDYLSHEIKYRYGGARRGLDAMADVLLHAAKLGIPRYAVSYFDEWAQGDDRLAYCLQPFVPKRNRVWKYDSSAFGCERGNLERVLRRDGPFSRLLLMGYDRDFCLLDTARDAVARGYGIISSERLMLSLEKNKQREASLDFYQGNTTFLETIPDVLNLLQEAVK